MPKTATKVSSKGTCIYCRSEFEKSKVSQHLKFCKPRVAKNKALNANNEPKVQLLHISIEATYLPMYWMHLEIPADHTLYDLDGFLRETWVECCDHLSEFKIGKTSYMSRTEDMMWNIQIVGAPDENEAENEEVVVEEEEEEALSPEEIIDRLLEEMAEEFGSSLNGMPVNEIEAKITDFLAQRMEADGGRLPSEAQPAVHMLASMIQLGALSALKEMPREDDMSVALGKVLKVGQKFSYTYDFGSSTDLTLKVVAEREGPERENEDTDTILVMARNEPPMLPCRSCGKPAIGVFSGYGAPEYGAVCEVCAKTARKEYDDFMMPIVNSPRIGVCGYTGGEGVSMEEWDEEEGDEEDEEE